MQFSSILFDKNYNTQELSCKLDFYIDLNLEQIIDTTVANKKEFDIKRFFYIPLDDIDTITYRQNILKDLQNGDFCQKVDEFAKKMLEIQRLQEMIETLEYREFEGGWFLQMVSVYCDALELFAKDLKKADLHSKGLLLFYDFLVAYLNSSEYKSLKDDMSKLKIKLESITYEININGITFKVKKYDGEADYTQMIEKIFQKFKQDEVSVKECWFDKNRGMNHVFAKILEFVGRLYPAVFAELENFTKRYKNFAEVLFLIFATEVEFYLSYLDYIAGISTPSLHFCYPSIDTKSKNIEVLDGFDTSLAYKLSLEKKPIVTNSFFLKDSERIMVVSGANQGGKSTFARAFGQMNYLAKLGLLVPAQKAKLFLTDAIFTHFEKEEQISTLQSKLQVDLFRVYDIFQKASGRSLVILNEIFSSTSLQDAIFLSKQIMDRVDELDLLCVWVTFIEKVNDMSDKTISFVSDIDKEDVEYRTYKIIRKDADGVAYVKSIAQKYRLNYEQILQRIEE